MSHWEKMLQFQIKALKLPEPDTELSIINGRKWRFDFGWPSHKLLVEVHGGTGDRVQGRVIRGRHVSFDGFRSDREKMNAAVLEGWRVLELTGEHVKSGKGIEWIEKALTRAS